MKISIRHLGDYVKKLHQKVCRTYWTIVFPYSTNHIVDVRRYRGGRRFFHSLMCQSARKAETCKLRWRREKASAGKRMRLTMSFACLWLVEILARDFLASYQVLSRLVFAVTCIALWCRERNIAANFNLTLTRTWTRTSTTCSSILLLMNWHLSFFSFSIGRCCRWSGLWKRIFRLPRCKGAQMITTHRFMQSSCLIRKASEKWISCAGIIRFPI